MWYHVRLGLLRMLIGVDLMSISILLCMLLSISLCSSARRRGVASPQPRAVPRALPERGVHARSAG